MLKIEVGYSHEKKLFFCSKISVHLLERREKVIQLLRVCISTFWNFSFSRSGVSGALFLSRNKSPYFIFISTLYWFLYLIGFPIFATILLANHVAKKDGDASTRSLTDEDVKAIISLSRDERLADRIVASVEPSIYGHNVIQFPISFLCVCI